MIKKYKIIVSVSAAVLMVNWAVVFFVLGGQADHVVRLQKRVADLRKDAGKKETGAMVGVAAKQAEIDRVLQHLPGELSFSQYPAKILAMVEKNGLSLVGDLGFSPAKTQISELIEYKTTLTAAGRYPDIKQFIADLKNLDGLKVLRSIRVQRDKQGKRTVVVDMGLSLFFRRKGA